MDDEGIASPGPGSGGSPAPSGEPDPDERAEAASDPQVKALVEELRSDRDAVEVPVDDAAEQAGSGTDR